MDSYICSWQYAEQILLVWLGSHWSKHGILRGGNPHGESRLRPFSVHMGKDHSWRSLSDRWGHQGGYYSNGFRVRFGCHHLTATGHMAFANVHKEKDWCLSPLWDRVIVRQHSSPYPPPQTAAFTPHPERRLPGSSYMAIGILLFVDTTH